DVEAHVLGKRPHDLGELALRAVDPSALLHLLGTKTTRTRLAHDRAPATIVIPLRSRIGDHHASGDIDDEDDALPGDVGAEERELGSSGLSLLRLAKEVSFLRARIDPVPPIESAGKANAEKARQRIVERAFGAAPLEDLASLRFGALRRFDLLETRDDGLDRLRPLVVGEIVKRSPQDDRVLVPERLERGCPAIRACT